MKTKTGKSGAVPGEKIRVCIRVRPLLAPYEDEEVWGVDLKENKVNSLSTAGTDPMTMMMNQI
jgi:hypothetical protein